MSFYQLIVGISIEIGFVKAPLILFYGFAQCTTTPLAAIYMKSRESEGMHEIKAAEV